MKLLNREPTEEMLSALNGYPWEDLRKLYYAMFDAAPEIKIDMEPVAWILPTSPIRIVDHMNFNANYGGTVKPLYSTEQVATLQSKLDERDNTILEQQYQLNIAFSMLEVQGVSKERAKYVSTGIHVLATRMKKEITALESALKAERINTLEEAAERIDKFGERMAADGNGPCNHLDCEAELRRMAAELKEGK